LRGNVAEYVDAVVIGGGQAGLAASYYLSEAEPPVILGGGKRLFEGFDETFDLEHVGLLQSPFATHVGYRVVR
jgi:glycine/D-amino acid oxidase-like deaminating enzyme